MKRIYLSPPHLGEEELELVTDAIASNWIAPLGPHVDAFEVECAKAVGVPHAAALSSGTAALHLALVLIGVQPGDEVLCSTLTFSASANPICYERGHPVFIDSEPGSWNMDPALLAAELEACAARGTLPRAVIAVDLYGQTADHDALLAACDRYGVPLIEDAAEALGSTYRGRGAGSFGRFGVLSFNGNKIITASGGGMLLSQDGAAIARARNLASQARDPAPHYQHSTLGYNYRMSNVLAAIGRGQLAKIEARVAARRANFAYYREALTGIPGVSMMPVPEWGRSNHWLTCVTIDPAEFGATREDVRLALEAESIEARPIWKPLHLQPVFASCRTRGGAVAEGVFERGLCLPSGSSLTGADRERVVSVFKSARR